MKRFSIRLSVDSVRVIALVIVTEAGELDRADYRHLKLHSDLAS